MLDMGTLLAPIPGANTAGANLRYEPLYSQIKEARREDDDLPKGEWAAARKEADWPLVVRLASDALAKRSKDLELAGWLIEALLHRDGIPGLRDGLALVHQLLEQFWDGVYPEIDEDGLEMRAARVEWIGVALDDAVRRAPVTASLQSLIDYRTSRTVPTKQEAESDDAKRQARAQATKDGKVMPEDFEAAFVATPKAWYRQLVSDLDATSAEIQSLDELCRQRFGDVSPSFRPLRDAVVDVRQVAGQLLSRKPPEPGDEPAAVAGSSPLVGAVSAANESTARAAGAFSSEGPRTRDEAAAWIAAAATRIRRDRTTDPAAYLMVRGFRWGELRGVGGAVDPRLLIAPSTEIRTRLRGLRLDSRWPELLDAAEEVTAGPVGRGWLDLQRYVFTACDALGGEYQAVWASIRGALRALLADVPDLPSLTLMDDSPTANAETLTWLRAEGLLDGEPEGIASPPAAERPRSSARRDAYDVARERVRAGDSRGAMELLMREAMQEKSSRARFIRRAQAAEVMVGAGLEAVALPILRELVAQIDEHKLDDWDDGETLAQPMGLLYRCLSRLDEAGPDRQALYVRICRLDPVLAIALGDASAARNE
jgi:type VI secretion system protein ImpA